MFIPPSELLFWPLSSGLEGEGYSNHCKRYASLYQTRDKELSHSMRRRKPPDDLGGSLKYAALPAIEE